MLSLWRNFTSVSHSRRVAVNFVRTSHERRLSVRLKRAERINKVKEIGVERKRERERDESQERKRAREAEWEWKKDREGKREENCLSCYRRYVSVNMCPASEHTGLHTWIHRFQFLSSFSASSSSSGRDSGGGCSDDDDVDGGGGGGDEGGRRGGGRWLPVDCTLRTALCAYTGSLICASTSG